jgi:CheY-like chemotaxis protein
MAMRAQIAAVSIHSHTQPTELVFNPQPRPPHVELYLTVDHAGHSVGTDEATVVQHARRGELDVPVRSKHPGCTNSCVRGHKQLLGSLPGTGVLDRLVALKPWSPLGFRSWAGIWIGSAELMTANASHVSNACLAFLTGTARPKLFLEQRLGLMTESHDGHLVTRNNRTNHAARALPLTIKAEARSPNMPQAEVTLPIEILLVEDNPGDARLAIEALKDGKLRNRITVVTDGEQALRFLKRHDPYTRAVRPDLVLLDLNLPRKDGREVLAEIRADPKLQSLPVAVLTASADEQDVLASHRLATCYIVMPVDAPQLLAVVASVAHFWIRVDSFRPADVSKYDGLTPAPTAMGVSAAN